MGYNNPSFTLSHRPFHELEVASPGPSPGGFIIAPGVLPAEPVSGVGQGPLKDLIQVTTAHDLTSSLVQVSPARG
jgi:hypothetical protein